MDVLCNFINSVAFFQITMAELDLSFLRWHQGVLTAIQTKPGGLPASFDSDWNGYILRVARAVPGTDPDKYHHVSSGELQTLSPRLWQSVHGLLPDGKAHLYERLRQRKYRVAANSLHPLKETVATVQLFTLVANSEYLPFNFISYSNRCNNHPLQITYVNP